MRITNSLETQQSNTSLPVPQILNIQNGECVYQRFLLIYGRAGPADVPFESTITVHHHNKNFPSTTWSVFNTHFKCLVHLEPGQNDLRFEFNPPVGAPITTAFQINYIPLLQNPPLHLAILVSKDSELVIDAPREKRDRHENTLEATKAKLRCAAYLWQAFTAEQMARNNFGRRVFRLDEDWETETMTNQEVSLRQTARIHIVRTKYTRAELLEKERAQQWRPPPGTPPTTKEDLYSIFLAALAEHGAPFDKDCYVAGLILDSHYDPKIKLIRGHAALGGGAGHVRLGIFGSHLTHSWPRFIEEVAGCFQDDTKIDETLANDNGDCWTYWRSCNIGIGAMLHEAGHALSCPHAASGVMLRGYVNLNRTFTVKEPHNPEPIKPSDEAGSHWHRCDVVRFRFHPCFRLPLDPPKLSKFLHVAPDFWPLEDSVLVQCSAGISLMEIQLNDDLKYHLEYIDNPVYDVRLQVHAVKERVNWKEGQKIRLHVVARNQSENTIENFELFLPKHKITLPSIGTAMKSFRLGNIDGLEFETILRRKPSLTKIRINSGDFVDGITFYWSDGTSESCGGKGGKHTDFSLAPDEYITSIIMRSGLWIDGLEIRTNRNQTTGWLGGRGGSMHVLSVPPGHEIVGVYGSTSWVLSSFGIIYKNVQK